MEEHVHAPLALAWPGNYCDFLCEITNSVLSLTTQTQQVFLLFWPPALSLSTERNLIVIPFSFVSHPGEKRKKSQLNDVSLECLNGCLELVQSVGIRAWREPLMSQHIHLCCQTLSFFTSTPQHFTSSLINKERREIILCCLSGSSFPATAYIH